MESGFTPSQTSFKSWYGGKGILLEIPAHLRPSEGKKILSFVFVPMAVAFEQVFTCYSLELCYSAVTAVLSIVLQCYNWLPFNLFCTTELCIWVNASVSMYLNR